ncbi:Delta(12) fatty acid desaturase [Diplonema papillatum]|nr:Delta(12) fatty acid desaturase [Diplonema papillatum]
MTSVQSVSERLAMFGGHVNSVFKTLKRNLAEQADCAKPYIEMCSDALKACYPDLYGEDVSFDLMEALARDSLRDEDGSDPKVALPLLTIGHLTNYMVHLKTSHKTPAESAKEFSAAFGDRNGMISAIAVSSSRTEAEFKENTVNAIKTAVVAGGQAGLSHAELVQLWANSGIEFPTSQRMDLPVLGPDGAGDLSKKDAELADTLAAILCQTRPKKKSNKDENMLKEAKKRAKTVVDFGVPAAPYGKLSLPIDGIRDMGALHEALPDIAEIKKVINEAGYTLDVNLPLSFFWLFHDLALAAVCIYGGIMAYPYVSENFFVKWLVAWPIWSAVFGTVLTGIWVIGHECGHRAFAGTGANTLINDVVGFLTHTPLLVPFWAWRYSHHKHHMYTNHLLDGETHVPSHKKVAMAEQALAESLGEEAFAFWNLVRHLIFGWPMYLLKNATGGRRTPQGEKIDRRKSVSHFNPESQIFDDNQRSMILPGALGCLAWIAVVLSQDYYYGMGTSLFWYWGSYLVVNAWLVTYTWLQHADVEVPHFSDGHFTYMRGATSTIDRAYPAWINYIHHHIGSTHVMHHISFQVPHYRAEDATRVYREKYPHLYRYDNRPVLSALWNVAKTCHYVDEVNGVQYYKPTSGLPPRRSMTKQKSA